MVQRVEAWKASDGSIHGSAQRAAEHELRLKLTKILGNEDKLINRMMERRMPLFEALNDYIAGATKAVEADNAKPR